ncbi:hypothetical protein [Mesorhizobium sp. B2-4-6]|uniref:hypothetical protein n=1 Tax=Mesorhizobium sp. B2-4-6 TaxID=2589943 RepID=UPI00112E334C|nr:hypothetical protein [Mesorhizobium sp. B2-4-6]TPL45435.1 hypothetical protein FJ957_21265 [Mesorhizobium sp. B2-4-6]
MTTMFDDIPPIEELIRRHLEETGLTMEQYEEQVRRNLAAQRADNAERQRRFRANQKAKITALEEALTEAWKQIGALRQELEALRAER